MFNSNEKCGNIVDVCSHAAASGYASIIHWITNNFRVDIAHIVRYHPGFLFKAGLSCDLNILQLVEKLTNQGNLNHPSYFITGSLLMRNLEILKQLVPKYRQHSFSRDEIRTVIMGGNMEMLTWILNCKGFYVQKLFLLTLMLKLFDIPFKQSSDY